VEGLELATLQTRTSRRVGSKEYVKSELVIPRELVQKLSWSNDQTINFRLHGSNKLLLIPTEPRQRPIKLAFETFAATVLRVLAEHPQGLIWSEIRQLGELSQITPNPIWVYRMQRERGLQRVRDGKSLQILWKLTSPTSDRAAI